MVMVFEMNKMMQMAGLDGNAPRYKDWWFLVVLAIYRWD